MCLFIISLVSCAPVSPLGKARNPDRQSPAPVRDEISLEPGDVLIIEDPGNTRIIEIYKDEVLDNCERKFIDLLGYYRNGELLAAKILFDNLLESLEYLYGDRKVSDSAMLQDFWNEFSNQGIKNSGVNIFDLYNSLYTDESLFAKDEGSNELVIEKTEALKVRQNNPGFLYLTEKVSNILSDSAKPASDEFVRSVYENYENYLSDRIGVKETYIRSQKYIKFLKTKLKENGLNEIYAYIPAVMTSFYEGTKNGSIWRVENIKEFRSFRNDTGASTAMVMKKLKELSSKNNHFNVIATILEGGKYNFEKKDLRSDIYTDNFAGFLAMTVILSNPEDHEFGSADITGTGEQAYFASYENYIKNPAKFTAPQKVTETQSGRPDYSKSFIRIMYKVKKGDNLDKIAELFRVSVSDLKKWNPKDTAKKYLYPGMTLYVQGDNFQYYVAKSGDSIGKITSMFKMTESDFKKINDMTSSTIFKGRKYIVRKK